VFFGTSFDDVSSFSIVSDLALPDRSWMIFVGCREESFPRNIYPDCYVVDDGDSYSWLANDVDQAVWFVFPGILVVVLLPMSDDYSNGSAHARSLGTAAKIKLWENPHRYLQVMIWYSCLIYAAVFKKL
jgi:hypothetical protein